MEVLSNIWAGYSSELVAAGLAMLIAVGTYYLRPRVSLIWGQANKSWHSIPIEKSDVHIINVKNFVQNTGRAPATNVEVVYEDEPTNLLIFPQRYYSTSKNPDGAHIVTIPFIAPKELITLDGVFINMNRGNVLSVKCKEREGKQVTFWVIRRLPNWFYNAFLIFSVLGTAFIISTFIKIIG